MVGALASAKFQKFMRVLGTVDESTSQQVPFPYDICIKMNHKMLYLEISMGDPSEWSMRLSRLNSTTSFRGQHIAMLGLLKRDLTGVSEGDAVK